MARAAGPGRKDGRDAPAPHREVGRGAQRGPDPLNADHSALLDRLVAITPEVARRWKAACESGGIGPDEPYNAAGALAQVLFDLREDQSPVFVDVFRDLERELVAADAAARNLLIVGLLEDLQNISLNNGVELDYWKPWLGPATHAAWRKLEELWSGRVSATEFNAFVDTVPNRT